MNRKIPQIHYVYEFSYPEGMSDKSGKIFYIGKAKNLSRMDHHFREASQGCSCDKCTAICSIWDAGLVVVRRIVFESLSDVEAYQEEQRRIKRHRSSYLTNMQGTGKPYPSSKIYALFNRLDYEWTDHIRWMNSCYKATGIPSRPVENAAGVRSFASSMDTLFPSKKGIIAQWTKKKIAEYESTD